MKPKLLVACTFAAFVAAPQITAAADAYKIDPQHAWVSFAINHAGWSSAIGKFKAFSGDIVFDKSDVKNSSVKVEIDAASVDTNFIDRDRDLNSPDFLNTAEFPKITFESTAIEPTGDKTGKVSGTLTMIGVSKPVTLDVTWNAEQPLPWDAKVIKTGLSATGMVKPADFGMHKVTEFGLGPDIRLTIEVEAFKQ